MGKLPDNGGYLHKIVDNCINTCYQDPHRAKELAWEFLFILKQIFPDTEEKNSYGLSRFFFVLQWSAKKKTTKLGILDIDPVPKGKMRVYKKL